MSKDPAQFTELDGEQSPNNKSTTRIGDTKEMLAFPRGRHDDMIDAASGAFNCLMDLHETHRYRMEPLIASGEDSEDEHRPIADDEMAELPDFLREMVTESRHPSGSPSHRVIR